MRVIRTAHFADEQAADQITEEEIAPVWTRPDLERPSQDHDGAVVRTAQVPDGSRVAVVGKADDATLVLITTWRQQP